MGYTTDFEGHFTITPPLEPAQIAYLTAFSGTRRMRRDGAKAARLPDNTREAVGLPIGPQGGYFVGARGFAGQDGDESVLNNNSPPEGQPSLWCHWVPTDDGAELVWDGGEKFYSYVEWLGYVVDHFLTPWGRTLSGTVEWFGEDRTDIGRIVCVPQDGKTTISAQAGRVEYSPQ